MATKYPDRVRDDARKLWLRGGKTDEEIAAAVGVSRADTIRDWRRDGEWEGLRDLFNDEVAERLAKARRDVSAKHDQLAEAIEAMIVRLMARRRADGLPATTARSTAAASAWAHQRLDEARNLLAIRAANDHARRQHGLDSPRRGPCRDTRDLDERRHLRGAARPRADLAPPPQQGVPV